jgi:hypothetical protein
MKHMVFLDVPCCIWRTILISDVVVAKNCLALSLLTGCASAFISIGTSQDIRNLFFLKKRHFAKYNVLQSASVVGAAAKQRHPRVNHDAQCEARVLDLDLSNDSRSRRNDNGLDGRGNAQHFVEQPLEQ